MYDQSEQGVEHLGARSMLMVWGLTIYNMLFAGVLTIIGFLDPKWAWMFSLGLFIPLIFLVPSVHHLAREFLRLQKRVRDLEKKLAQPSTGAPV